jgi:hypothetical protein
VKRRGFFRHGFAKGSFRTIASFFTAQPIGKMVTAVCASIFLICYGGGRMRSFILVLGAGILTIIPGYAQDAASGEKIFVQCKACHQIGENAKNAVGPVLNGLFG